MVFPSVWFSDLNMRSGFLGDNDDPEENKRFDRNKNRVCGYLPLTTCLPPPSTNLQRQVLVEKVSEKLSIVLVENNKVNEQSLREQSLREQSLREQSLREQSLREQSLRMVVELS